MSIEKKTIDVKTLRSLNLQDLLSDEVDFTEKCGYNHLSLFCQSLAESMGSLPAPYVRYVFNSLISSYEPDSLTFYFTNFDLAALKFCFDCVSKVYSDLNDNTYMDCDILMTILFANLFAEVKNNG